MKVLTNNQYYSQIANVIREQNGTSNTYKPPQMVSALKDLFYEEVEGVPPITFNGNGENLIDYRIDGASGGVGDRTGNLFDKKNTEIIHAYFSPENLWQVNEDSSSIIIKVLPNTQYTLSIGTAISIFRIYKTSLENPEPGKSNVFTPIIRSSNIKTYTFTTDNDITYIIFQGTNAETEMWINSLVLNIGSTSLPSYEPFGYKVPVVVNGKNLLKINATSQTINGVTFTVNEDGSVTCNTDENGATADTRFYLLGIGGTDFKRIECDTAIKLTGCPSGGSSSTYYISLLRQNDSTYPSYNSYADFGNGFVPSYDATNKYVIYIQIKSGQVCTNLTFYPMIRKADIEDGTYEPYIEPTTTNIYLDEPLCNVNNNIDYIDFSSQSKIKKTGTIEFVNSSNWLLEGEHNFYYDMVIETASSKSLVVSNKVPSLATSMAETIANQYPENIWISAGQRVNLWLADIDHTLTALQNWLSQEPLIVQYQLQNHSEISVNLPTIPTKRGTNVLSVDTEVQPSKVYVKSRKESSYETTMRENYEQELSDIESALQEV